MTLLGQSQVSHVNVATGMPYVLHARLINDKLNFVKCWWDRQKPFRHCSCEYV